jgi:hypothetical protein
VNEGWQPMHMGWSYGTEGTDGRAYPVVFGILRGLGAHRRFLIDRGQREEIILTQGGRSLILSTGPSYI